MKWTWIIGLVWLPAVVAAEPLTKDALGLSARFSDARVVQEQTESVTERLYPLGAVRRIAGRLRMDGEVNVGGELSARTYRLPERHSGLEAFSDARLALAEQGGELLYWCEGRDCGASNLWANEIFGQSRLYGPESQQAYLLMRLSQPADALVAAYAITRGNGRAYLHVEHLKAERSLAEILPTPATLLRQLRDDDELVFKGLSDVSPDWLAVLLRTLRQDSTMRVSLSGQAAAIWYDALVGKGVRASRLEVDDSSEPGLRMRRLR